MTNEYKGIRPGNFIYVNTDDISGRGKNYFPGISEDDYYELLETEIRYGGCMPLIAKRLPGSKFELVTGYSRLRDARNNGRKMISVLPVDMDRSFLRYFAVEHFLSMHRLLRRSLVAKLFDYKKKTVRENGWGLEQLYEPKYESPVAIDRYVSASRLVSGLSFLFDRGDFDLETAANLSRIPQPKQWEIFSQIQETGKMPDRCDVKNLKEQSFASHGSAQKDALAFFTEDDGGTEKKKSNECPDIIVYARKSGMYPPDYTDREITSDILSMMDRRSKNTSVRPERRN